MKGAVRFRRRLSVAHSTLVMIVMMCLNEKEEIILDETSIDIFFPATRCCTVTVKMAIQYGADIVQLCKALQKQIVNEIETMTTFKVEHVHIIVERLI